MNVTFKTGSDLVMCLSLYQGEDIVTIESVTEVKTKKKNSLGEKFDDEFSGPVFCRKIQKVRIGVNYEDAVNAKRKKDGETPDFKVGKLPWGKWVKQNVIIEHNGAHYLRFYVGLNKTKTVYEYQLEDGTVLGKNSVDKLTDFMTKRPQKDPDAIQPRNINLDNVQKLFLGENTYIKED